MRMNSIEDCVPKAQNMDQSLSQFPDIITTITNMSRGDIIFFPSTPLSRPLAHLGCSSHAHVSQLAAILKHIRVMEDEDLEVFVDTQDNQSTPISPFHAGFPNDRALTLLSPNVLQSPCRRHEAWTQFF